MADTRDADRVFTNFRRGVELGEMVAKLRAERAELVEALRLALKVTEIDCQETGARPFPWFHKARALLEKIGG